MQMMNCPHCGTGNSVKREHCYQCDGHLRGAPNQTADLEYVPTCANCVNSAIFPPAGVKLGREQVWCAERGEAFAASHIAGDCFSEAFSWKREDILD